MVGEDGLKVALSSPPVGDAVDLSGVPLGVWDMECLAAHLCLHTTCVRSLELGFTELTDQPFLMGLRKHCPKQCKLPTIQEQEDAQRQEGHAQGKYSNGMPTEGESRAGAVDGTSGEWQGWRTLDDTEEEEEEEEELEDELWDCNMRNPVNGDGIQKYLKSVVHSGVGKSSFSQSKQPIGRKIDDHVSPQSTNQT
ncbi:unnamed protein product [Coregonus sp. 'balchen']|nr:unnamed protein product [Coregonus sp. 'balchen']